MLYTSHGHAGGLSCSMKLIQKMKKQNGQKKISPQKRPQKLQKKTVLGQKNILGGGKNVFERKFFFAPPSTKSISSPPPPKKKKLLENIQEKISEKYFRGPSPEVALGLTPNLEPEGPPPPPPGLTPDLVVWVPEHYFA